MKWMHFIHNRVNIINGKPTMTYEDSLDAYFKHYDLENHNGQDFSGSRDLNGNRTEVSWNGWGTNVNRLNPNVRFEIYRPDENNRQFCQIHYYNNDASIYHANYMDAVWSNDTSAKKGWSMYGNGGANFINGFYVITGYKYQ